MRALLDWNPAGALVLRERFGEITCVQFGDRSVRVPACSVRRALSLTVMLGAGAVLAACSDGAPSSADSGSLSGQVVVSGPLRRAAVSIDQIDLKANAAVAIRAHVADTTTDDDGRFSVQVGKFNGLLLVTARGGAFTDLATGATIQLDTNTSLETITWFDLFDEREDVLVSPVGALVAARTRGKVSQLGNVVAAERDAAEHLDRHFGSVVDWSHLRLGSLEIAATSPTEPVRAALVQAALSFLARDIAHAAGASPQEVNVLTLTQQLAADVGQDAFDGNDGNAPAFGEGLQLGVCERLTGCHALAAGTCALSACRPLCDLYAGTARTLLAGEMTSVIRDPTLNHTGLVTGDILAVARSMADNLDVDLFGSACVEDLDRLSPRLTWVMPTPDELAYVRASFRVKATASDDTDPMPQVAITGYAYDGSNAAATATIDSTTSSDGRLELVAVAHDMAGNTAMIHRTVQVDNTAPAVTLDPAGFFVDGPTWWTAAASPTLHGTVIDVAPVTIDATVSTTTAGGMVAGARYTVVLPGHALDMAGGPVSVVATDAAGNQRQLSQRMRVDLTPPQLTVQPSIVNNEAQEPVEFLADEVPRHTHNGTEIDLAATGTCPSITKFSYLLGERPPVHGLELPRPNPIHYVVVTTDDGVGVAGGSTQYRVGFREGTTTRWLLDWTPAGPPTPLGPGVDLYDVGIVSDTVPQLSTTEGVYDVELRTSDRLGRTATTARCFDLHLRAPPLHFVDTAAPHAYQLQSLSLAGGAFRAIAARLLNDHATGASLIDKDVTNGTAETVYLEVAVTRPASVTLSQRFVLANFSARPQGTELSCLAADGGDPENCSRPTGGPSFESPTLNATTVNTLNFPARVFELDATGAPTTELPCLVCGAQEAGTMRLSWKFAIPPRSGAGARRFKIMTMIGQASGLWPQDMAHPVSPPFVDTAFGGHPFTGAVGVSDVGCSTILRAADGTPEICIATRRVTAYRALKEVHVVGGDMGTSYRTAPTPQLHPATAAADSRLPPFSWTTTAATLP
jgi:hypothetical protein